MQVSPCVVAVVLCSESPPVPCAASVVPPAIIPPAGHYPAMWLRCKALTAPFCSAPSHFSPNYVFLSLNPHSSAGSLAAPGSGAGWQEGTCVCFWVCVQVSLLGQSSFQPALDLGGEMCLSRRTRVHRACIKALRHLGVTGSPR